VTSQLALPLHLSLASEAPAQVPRAKRIHVNRNLRLDTVAWVGFDMDYTLAIYRHPEMDRLSIEATVHKMVERFGRPTLIEQFDSLPIEDFQQEFEGKFVDETYSFFPYELILPCTNDELVLYDEPTSVRAPEGRIVAGFDVGRTRDRSELAVFEEIEGRFTARMLRSFEGTPFAEQEAELRRLLGTLPVARLSIDRSGIGMNLAENLSRDFPQVVGENFTNEAKERWATDFKILLQRKDVVLPKDRQLVAQIHSIKRRLTPTGKPSFEPEREEIGKGHADRFWSVALACQKERGPLPGALPEVHVRVIG
jgi:hypothetical protein